MARNFNDASVQYLSVADTASLDITGALTLFARNRRTSALTGGTRGLVAKWIGTGNLRSYGLVMSADSYVGFNISSDGTFQAGNATVASANASTQNSWASAAGRYVPSVSVSGWLDGIKETEKTASIAASIFSGAADMWIGAQFIAAADAIFIGDIADAAIWSAALTDDEIVSLSKGFKPTRIRPQSLVFYAPLIRNLQDTRGALTITNNNAATVAVHPRVY
jgi:hypothetical protein